MDFDRTKMQLGLQPGQPAEPPRCRSSFFLGCVWLQGLAQGKLHFCPVPCDGVPLAGIAILSGNHKGFRL
ncbi:MAG: hypothetical protein KA716_32025 [Gloeotrichia echinulata DEX184]|jgi:hypothetical protein|nr:hypothetical protein [Gloeotrichia echinulata DEX184]